MQKPRKRLPAELQYELTAFLDLHEQHKLRKICRSMNNLLRARIGENIPKMKAFCDYLEARVRVAIPSTFRQRIQWVARYNRRLAQLYSCDKPYQRIRDFRVLERKAAELFGPNGERVQKKNLTEPIYDNFLGKEFPSLNHELSIVVDKLSGESSHNEGQTFNVNIPDPGGQNFDTLFPKWMSQFRADWDALKALCAELDERRRWEHEMKHPTYPCDIHPGAPMVRIHQCAANKFHHLCEDCLRRVEESEAKHGYGQNQQQQCHICLPQH